MPDSIRHPLARLIARADNTMMGTHDQARYVADELEATLDQPCQWKMAEEQVNFARVTGEHHAD